MKIYDISVTVTPNIPVWPGDIPVWLERVKKLEDGASDNNSQMKMGVHTGTHVDSPFHFVKGGIKVDELPLETMIGPCQVIQMEDKVDLITAEEIKKSTFRSDVPRVIFKTRNEKYWVNKLKDFQEDFVGVSVDGADLLVKAGMKFVGVDYLSVAPYGFGKVVHDVLLKAGLILLEGVDLTGVPAGVYTLYCLPIKLGATEGAPARVILISD
jgi:arylformamidase